VAVSIERLWPTDAIGVVPVRVQDDLCVNEAPGGDSFVQSLAESESSRHGCESFEGVRLLLSAIFIVFSWCSVSAHFRLSPQNEPKMTGVA
jgi:hypothetical protein